MAKTTYDDVNNIKNITIENSDSNSKFKSNSVIQNYSIGSRMVAYWSSNKLWNDDTIMKMRVELVEFIKRQISNSWLYVDIENKDELDPKTIDYINEVLDKNNFNELWNWLNYNILNKLNLELGICLFWSNVTNKVVLKYAQPLYIREIDNEIFELAVQVFSRSMSQNDISSYYYFSRDEDGYVWALELEEDKEFFKWEVDINGVKSKIPTIETNNIKKSVKNVIEKSKEKQRVKDIYDNLKLESESKASKVSTQKVKEYAEKYSFEISDLENKMSKNNIKSVGNAKFSEIPFVPFKELWFYQEYNEGIDIYQTDIIGYANAMRAMLKDMDIGSSYVWYDKTQIDKTEEQVQSDMIKGVIGVENAMSDLNTGIGLNYQSTQTRQEQWWLSANGFMENIYRKNGIYTLNSKSSQQNDLENIINVKTPMDFEDKRKLIRDIFLTRLLNMIIKYSIEVGNKSTIQIGKVSKIKAVATTTSSSIFIHKLMESKNEFVESQINQLNTSSIANVAKKSESEYHAVLYNAQAELANMQAKSIEKQMNNPIQNQKGVNKNGN